MPSESEILVLSAADVRSLLDVDAAITSQQTAFEALGRGEALLPARLLVDGAEGSVSFCYAARLALTEGAVCKFGSVNPSNAARGVPTISAVITVLDGADGRPVALMDGTTVTTIRTSAASAVAIRALAAASSGSAANRTRLEISCAAPARMKCSPDPVHEVAAVLVKTASLPITTLSL